MAPPDSAAARNIGTRFPPGPGDCGTLAEAATCECVGGRFHLQEQAGAARDRCGQAGLNIAADGALERRQLLAGVARDGLTLAGAAGLVAWTLGVTNEDTPPSSRLLMITALPPLLAPLFGTSRAGVLRTLASHAATWGFATLLVICATALAVGNVPLDRLAAPLLMALGIVVVSQLAAHCAKAALRIAGTAPTVADDWARWLITALLWLLAAAPLWLGPLADLGASRGSAPAEAIVAASPLVHLALAAGQDLLRTEWFYAHTSLGGLQFEYPTQAAVAIAYVGGTAGLAVTCFLLSRFDAAGGAIARSSRTLKEHAR